MPAVPAMDERNTTVLHLGASERQLLGATDRFGLLGSQSFVDQVLDDLAWEGLAGPVGLLSLDVFDTVLLRRDHSEVRRFWEIAQAGARALTGVDPRDLFVSRLTATRASYRTSRAVDGYREGELSAIWRLAGELLGLTGTHAETLVRAELDYETANLQLNPAVPAVWERLGRPDCVAASNMYLSSAQIAELLDRNGAGFVTRVYSSTESKLSKNDTRLLARIADDAGVEATSCLHIGDSHTSDFVPAKRLGWHALLWPVPEPSQSIRKADAVACLEELEQQGVSLGSLAQHFVEHP